MSFADQEFLTVAEVARLLKLNQQTLRNWIDVGKLPAVRIGRRVRILRRDLDRMIEQGSSQPAPAAVTITGEEFWSGAELPPPLPAKK